METDDAVAVTPVCKSTPTKAGVARLAPLMERCFGVRLHSNALSSPLRNSKETLRPVGQRI